MEKKLQKDIQDIVIKRAHQTGKKYKNGSWPAVAQFSFYKDKMKMFKNCKKLINKMQDFQCLRPLPFEKKNGKSMFQI